MKRQAKRITPKTARELLEALKIAMRALEDNNIDEMMSGEYEILTDATTKAEKELRA